MGWFGDLTGFSEGSYDGTKSRLSVRNGRLYSDASEKSHGVGVFEMVSLEHLRRARADNPLPGRLALSVLKADVRDLHRVAENTGSLFQVASQFNMLEMTGPSVTPEDGVTRYAWDNTQGPACAIAAGAATIYRNYFVRFGDQTGQTAHRQLDGLAGIGETLSALTNLPVHALWTMENGYALASSVGLNAMTAAMATLEPAAIDVIRGKLQVGLHRDVEVTDSPEVAGQTVSQVFCSAMPIGYSNSGANWESIARLVLDATYEATLCCAEANAVRTGSRKLFLTLVGAGAFGNPRGWALDSAKRALVKFRNVNLEVAIVSHGQPPGDLQQFIAEFEAGL
jgi:hypothetical protein